MSRALALSLSGLLLGFAVLVVWILGPAMAWLDPVVAAALGLGLALSVAGLLQSSGLATRKLAVVAVGVNGIGLWALAMLFAPG